MTDLTQLPDDVKDTILRHTAAFSFACDLLERFTGQSSIAWGTTISVLACEKTAELSPTEKDLLLNMAQSASNKAGAAAGSSVVIVPLRKGGSENDN